MRIGEVRNRELRIRRKELGGDKWEVRIERRTLERDNWEMSIREVIIRGWIIRWRKLGR